MRPATSFPSFCYSAYITGLIVKFATRVKVSTIPARILNVNAIDYVNDRTVKRNIFFVSNDFIIGSSVYEIFRNAICAFHSRKGFSNSGIHMKKTLLAAGAVLALSSSLLSTQLKTTNRSIFPTGGTRALTLSEAITPVSDRSSATIPTLSTKHSLKDWFDFYGYADAPVFFGGNSDAKVSGTTVLRCLWKSNRVSPSTS